MDSHVKAGWSRRSTTETGKPIWSWLANVFFFLYACLTATEMTPLWFERLRGLRKHCPVHKITQAYSENSLFFKKGMVPGCIRHCHFPDTSELLRNSFKLVSVRNMTSTLVWRWIRESHFVFVCTLINTHYNSVLNLTFCLISPKTHYWKGREIEMQRNLWSKSVLTKEKMQWRDRRKSFIT